MAVEEEIEEAWNRDPGSVLRGVAGKRSVLWDWQNGGFFGYTPKLGPGEEIWTTALLLEPLIKPNSEVHSVGTRSSFRFSAEIRKLGLGIVDIIVASFSRQVPTFCSPFIELGKC